MGCGASKSNALATIVPNEPCPQAKRNPAATRPETSVAAPQLVAHLETTAAAPKDALQVKSASKQDLLTSAIRELTSDMEQLREATDFASTLSALLERRRAPMLLLDAEELRRRGRLPRFDEVEQALVQFSEVDPAADCVCFVSHRWWRNGVPDDDANSKVGIVLDQVDAVLRPRLGKGGRALLWWDFCSISQIDESSMHRAVKGAQILAIPFYLAAANVLIALRGGDEEAYTTAAGDLTSVGFYDNRVWTMLELFAYTSDFARSCSDKKAAGEHERLIVDVRLQYDVSTTVACARCSRGRSRAPAA